MCEQREQLLDYLYDEGSPELRRDVERHLEACDECRDEIRAFRTVREDLLAWGVPNPPSVWTPFAPAPVVPWHKQVPAWAFAAAASLMFVVGGAGGFLAHGVVEGRGTGVSGSGTAAAIPAAVTQASVVDSQAILSLIRQELASADRDAAGLMTPVSNTASRSGRLDAATEARLLARVSELVSTSQERQLGLVGDYLYKVAQEDERQRKINGQELSAMRARVEQLQAVVSQLSQMVLQQTKVQ